MENNYPTFVEMQYFSKHRTDYLSDLDFKHLQDEIRQNPLKGDLILGTGGLRKIRFHDGKKEKGKRSGVRVIYYLANKVGEIWLFTIYGKNEVSDLSPQERKAFKQALELELKERGLK